MSGREPVRYRVILPLHMAADPPGLDRFARSQVAGDMPRALGCTLVEGTARVAYASYREPRTNARTGAVVEAAKVEPWDEVSAIPQWATHLVMTIIAEAVRA